MRRWRNEKLASGLPEMAPRTVSGYSALARKPDVQRFIALVARRSLPPEILDESLLDRISEYIAAHGINRGAEIWKEQMTKTDLAMVRAVAMNVSRMTRAGVVWGK